MTKQSFNIVRHAGDPQSATTLWGEVVTRAPSLFVPEYKVNVPCAPYDNHFIYATNPNIKDIPSYMCTCGGPAVVINNYDKTKMMFVCLIHASTGRHTMSS